jgi:hypothetical protein
MTDNINDPYLNRLKFLDTEFEPFKEMFKEITRFVWPTAGNFLEEKNPSRQITSVYESIYDNTAELAVQNSGAGMMAGHMSPSLRWHRLTVEDPDLAKFSTVKRWLDKVEDILFAIYAKSNLYEIAHRGFEEQAAFGTEAIHIEEDFKTVARARIFTAGEYRLALGDRGIPDTLYRRTMLGAKVMVNMFGEDKVSDIVKRAAMKEPYSTFEVLHIIEPNDDINPMLRDPSNMPYRSIWIEAGNREQRLREKGFEEQPFSVTRARVRGNWPYGISPGMSALGMTRVLQEMEKSSLVGVHRMTSPPLIGNARFKGILNLMPDAINWASGTEDPFLRPLYQINMNIRELEAKQEQIRSRIGKSFYTDLFLMFADAASSGRQVTATEVVEKAAERRLILGPIVERQSVEKLDPIVDRIFGIALRNNMFPPVPDELGGIPIRVEYVGLLAQAQKLVELQSIGTWLGVVERVAAIDQNVLIKVNTPKIVEKAADITGVPDELIRNAEEVGIIQQQIQARQDKADALAEENAQLENVQKASEIDIEKLRSIQGG